MQTFKLKIRVLYNKDIINQGLDNRDLVASAMIKDYNLGLIKGDSDSQVLINKDLAKDLTLIMEWQIFVIIRMEISVNMELLMLYNLLMANV